MDFKHNENQIALYAEDSTLNAEVTFPYIDEETVDVNHTFVDDSVRDQGVAEELMDELVKDLESRNLKASLSCSYAAGWFEKHPEHNDLVKK